MRRLWIAELSISEATQRKLVGVHRIDPDDLRDRLVCVTGLRYVWDEHPARGRRALVEVRAGPRRILVILYPGGDREEETWRLGSAYVVLSLVPPRRQTDLP